MNISTRKLALRIKRLEARRKLAGARTQDRLQRIIDRLSNDYIKRLS